MNLKYQLNKGPTEFNEIYFNLPRVEILCGSNFGNLCCIKHRKFEFDLFLTFLPILILEDVAVKVMLS